MFRLLRWFVDDIVHCGRLPLLCCLLTFILTFLPPELLYALSATVPKLFGRRNRETFTSGWCIIHHLAFGVMSVMISGLTLVTLSIEG